MNKKSVLFAIFFLTIAISNPLVGQMVATVNQHATAVLDTPNQPIHAGSDVILKLKLNESLPKGAYFIVRLAPLSSGSQLDVRSSEPVNEGRTDFDLKFKMPEEVIPGLWHIEVIYFFMPGTSWTNTTIRPNDLRFKVDGHPIDLPTTAVASIAAGKS